MKGGKLRIRRKIQWNKQEHRAERDRVIRFVDYAQVDPFLASLSRFQQLYALFYRQ